MNLFVIKLDITLRYHNNNYVAQALNQIILSWNLDLPFIRSVILERSSNILRVSVLTYKIKMVLVSISWNSSGDYIEQVNCLTNLTLSCPLEGLTSFMETEISNWKPEKTRFSWHRECKQCMALIPIRRDTKTDLAYLVTCRIWGLSPGR